MRGLACRGAILRTIPRGDHPRLENTGIDMADENPALLLHYSVLTSYSKSVRLVSNRAITLQASWRSDQIWQQSSILTDYNI